MAALGGRCEIRSESDHPPAQIPARIAVRFQGKERMMSASTRKNRHVVAQMRHRRATAHRGAESINGVKSAVMGGAGKIRAALSEATGEVLESLGNVRNSATSGARERFNAARSTASDFLEQGKARAVDAEATVEKVVRSQPLTSLLIAVGAGFLFGAIWCRR
jgi:ElaB/YqjD/DUF883 family membrane-anchored ribosome-binding protein